MTTTPTIRVAALQTTAEIGNIDANLTQCAALAEQATTDGAAWVVLPEFFSTGVANRAELRDRAPALDGDPTALLCSLARDHGVHAGGSTLVRDDDGEVRNAFLLFGPDGELLGRHDKDLPTMWENALYVGGTDPGRITVDGMSVGVALCWEMLRSQTLARLGGQVDLLLGGSGWWSIPAWIPRRVTTALQAGNERRAIDAVSVFAAAVGSPFVHAAHAGELSCPWPPGGITYRGHYQGGAIITDHRGQVLAARYRSEGPGVAVADVRPTRGPAPSVPSSFWLQRRGAVAALCWAYQNPLGRRQYQAASSDRAGAAAVSV